MPLLLRFYDGDTPRVTYLHRRDLFMQASADFLPLENATNRSSIDRELKKSGHPDGIVLFLHLSRYTDAPDQMPLWSQELRESGIIVFYSGGGIGPENTRRIESARTHAKMLGRVFIHRPDFDGPLASKDQAVTGIRKFIQRVSREFYRCGESLKATRFLADEFGWPGIMEHSHLEYASGVLYALLGAAYGGEARLKEAQEFWRQLESLKNEAVSSLQRRGAKGASELNHSWNECEVLFTSFQLHRGSLNIEQIIILRDSLLGGEFRKGLVNLLASAWEEIFP